MQPTNPEATERVATPHGRLSSGDRLGRAVLYTVCAALLMGTTLYAVATAV